MNITEKVENFVQYILGLIEQAKGYVDDIIEFFVDLRDKIENFLEYIEDKLHGIEGLVSELKQHTADAATE
jgi:hypothetical protein